MSNLDILLSRLLYTNAKRVKDDYLELEKALSDQSLIQDLKIDKGKFVLPGYLFGEQFDEQELIFLSGIIPIFYEKKNYGIQIDIILPKTYPDAAPIVYVRRPLQGRINYEHSNVNSEGLVCPEAFESSSSLCELVSLLSSAFSLESPVYMDCPPSLQSSVHETFQSSGQYSHQHYNNYLSEDQFYALQYNQNYHQMPAIKDNELNRVSNVQSFREQNIAKLYQLLAEDIR